MRTGERTAAEVVDPASPPSRRATTRLNAFVVLDADLARARRRGVDAAVAAREDPGPLAGVPFGVKDLEDCAGMPTSHGSLLFKDRARWPQDSVQVGRLRAAGAVPLGKTAAPEFGTLNFTKTKAWGITRNPWALDRTPGRLERRLRRRGRRRPRAVRHGQRRRRVHPDPGGLHRARRPQGRLRAHPEPRSERLADRGQRGAHDDRRRRARHLDVVAGPDDGDRMSLPAPTVGYEQAIEELDVAGLRARWSVDLGFAEPSTRRSRLTAAAASELASRRRACARRRASCASPTRSGRG